MPTWARPGLAPSARLRSAARGRSRSCASSSSRRCRLASNGRHGLPDKFWRGESRSPGPKGPGLFLCPKSDVALWRVECLFAIENAANRCRRVEIAAAFQFAQFRRSEAGAVSRLYSLAIERPADAKPRSVFGHWFNPSSTRGGPASGQRPRSSQPRRGAGGKSLAASMIGRSSLPSCRRARLAARRRRSPRSRRSGECP